MDGNSEESYQRQSSYIEITTVDRVRTNVCGIHASTSTLVKRSREPTEETEETEDLSRRQFGLTDLIRLVADVATRRSATCLRRCHDGNGVSVFHCDCDDSTLLSTLLSFSKRIESSRRSQLVDDSALLMPERDCYESSIPSTFVSSFYFSNATG